VRDDGRAVSGGVGAAVNISPAGVALVKQFEGLRLAAYPDPGSGGDPWTIGYGTTIYPSGDKVQRGDTITAEQAEEYLRHDLRKFESAVSRAVLAPVSQEQFDALVSLTYNIGEGAFGRSTLLRKLNAGDASGAAEEFLRWVNAGGKPMAGLRRRREAERAMFLATDTASSKPMPVAFVPKEKTMSPALIAFLPSLISAIPQLAKLFGTGSAVSDRNIKAAETVAQIVVSATGAPNLQGAVEAIQADPAARQQATSAVEAAWFQLVEAGGGGIDGARKFNVAAAETAAWRMPAVWITVALLLPVYATVGSVLWGEGWSNEIRLQVVTAVLVVISVVSAYWLGSSSGSQRKTDMLADK
jgi:lysozyme